MSSPAIRRDVYRHYVDDGPNKEKNKEVVDSRSGKENNKETEVQQYEVSATGELVPVKSQKEREETPVETTEGAGEILADMSDSGLKVEYATLNGETKIRVSGSLPALSDQSYKAKLLKQFYNTNKYRVIKENFSETKKILRKEMADYKKALDDLA